MTLKWCCADRRGTSSIEFAITAPVFFMLLFGTIEGGLLLWTQLGLQHGAEMGARCASVNTTLCNSAGAIQAYAVQNAFGLSLPPSTFSVATPTCGNEVSATFTYNFIVSYFGVPSITLTARSCFPK